MTCQSNYTEHIDIRKFYPRGLQKGALLIPWFKIPFTAISLIGFLFSFQATRLFFVKLLGKSLILVSFSTLHHTINYTRHQEVA